MSIQFTPWPEDIATDYINKGYWSNEPLTHIIHNQLQNNGNKLALICQGRTFTYRDIDSLSNQLASHLLARKLPDDATALVHLPNSAEFYIVFFALLKCGITPVNALFSHSSHELIAFSKQIKPALVILSTQHTLVNNDYVTAQLLTKLGPHCINLDNTLIVGGTIEGSKELAPMYWINNPSKLSFNDSDSVDIVNCETAAEQVAFFQLSGGSTGTPKLIPRTHNDYYYSIRQSALICELSHNTVYLCALPAPHNFTLSSPGALGVFYAGGTVVTASDPSPTTCFPLIKQHGVTFTALVPPALHLWLKEANQSNNVDTNCTVKSLLCSLKTIQVGGAKLSCVIAEQVNNVLNCQLQQVFGMAEGLVNYTLYSDSQWHINNTQGKPMSPCDEIKVLNEAGLPVAIGEVGELWTRGPYTFRGYYKSPAINKLAFDHHGFYCTGDLVKLTPSGHLIVMGRNKDQINRGGEKIDALEIEELLLHIPAITDIALVALADDILGESSCAVVVKNTEIKARDIRRYLREQGVSSYKIPDHVVFVDDLPKTAVGKTDKRYLRRSLTTNMNKKNTPEFTCK
ncbi:AMP-binding protein [uncultured Shewanella sp.]|uniref:AMP-binding protein n=1 Tax=uncultured Shewanella sp. TaxID=173975 RepID=UPI00260DB2D3|nr:AMP-binding protein [uncultured Shewanella sp.]